MEEERVSGSQGRCLSTVILRVTFRAVCKGGQGRYLHTVGLSQQCCAVTSKTSGGNVCICGVCSCIYQCGAILRKHVQDCSPGDIKPRCVPSLGLVCDPALRLQVPCLLEPVAGLRRDPRDLEFSVALRVYPLLINALTPGRKKEEGIFAR